MKEILIGCIALCAGCGAGSQPMRIEDWVRVGVDPEQEARAVVATLVEGGYEVVERIDGEGFVAIGLARFADGRSAVRVVTRVGVAVSLDSHESDGFHVRHGDVSLVDVGRSDHDVDGDGRPEIVVARAGRTRCVAVLRIDDDGRARVVPIAAEALVPGSCASRLEDVDGDGRLEALIELAWPALALGDAVPSIRAALFSEGGEWRASAISAAFVEREEAERRAHLEHARQRLDVPNAQRLAVELAAIANLKGAARSAQVIRYDEALSGLVLDRRALEHVERVRDYIASGWGTPRP